VRDDAGYETSLIDVTETAIERPKKSSAATTGARKKAHAQKQSRRRQAKQPHLISFLNH
jgi:hypothetical protein